MKYLLGISMLTLTMFGAVFSSCIADVTSDQQEEVSNAINRFEKCLSDAFAINSKGSDNLLVLRTLSLQLASAEVNSFEERGRIAKLLGEYLGLVRSEIIPNYERLPVVSNVKPPSASGGPAISGMNPEAIADPVARAQYQEAIQKNQENNLMNIRQRELESANRLTSKYIVKYIADTFAGSDHELSSLVECMEKANLTDQEKDEINARMISTK